MPPRVPYRVLAVDDIPSNLLTLKAILPPEEFTFTGCAGAEEAFELMEGTTFDLVLLDILLPGIDGYTIAKWIKKNPRYVSVPIIFLTALSEEDEVVRGFEAGGVDFVSKPFHKTELLLRLRTHLALKDKNEALEQAAESLRQANQSRDRFFSVLAHDLKNPFAGFLSLAQEMVTNFDRLTKEDHLEALQTMAQTSQNVYRLLETLLDWGRSQTGAMTLDPQPQFIKFLVEEALEPIEESLRRKSISVIQELGTEKVVSDRYTVVTILRNLLSNAMKYTKPGGTVTIASRVEGPFVELTVADTGVGIPPERLKLLFHLENKISTPGTAREPGTGLGLILCEEFIQKNGGSIRVESRQGEGTSFFIRLPAVKESLDG